MLGTLVEIGEIYEQIQMFFGVTCWKPDAMQRGESQFDQRFWYQVPNKFMEHQIAWEIVPRLLFSYLANSIGGGFKYFLFSIGERFPIWL